MPRKPKIRRVALLPRQTYFKPAGIPLRQLEEEVLQVEELEALRLKDLEALEQEACARQMGISRATFFRIIGSARSKLARALIEGKAIRIEGGNFDFSPGREACYHCGFQDDGQQLHEKGKGKKITSSKGQENNCPRCGEKIKP